MLLARLSAGQITAVDIERSKLERLEEKVKKANFSEQIKVMHRSMFEFKFPEQSFDIVWSEGSIAAIGFTRGIKEWYRLIKPQGFLVVHDMTDSVVQKLEYVGRYGYSLLDHFTIPGEIWWSEYYEPLGKAIERLRNEHHNNDSLLAQLDKEELEVEKVKADPGSYSSTFFILQKT